MGGSLPLASIVSLSDKVPEPAEGPLPPLRGAPRNAPDSIVFPDLVGDLLLFVEEDSPAERHADHRPPVMLTKVSIGCRTALFISMFAPSGISHARTFTSFECSLCETPPLRKETREGLC